MKNSRDNKRKKSKCINSKCKKVCSMTMNKTKRTLMKKEEKRVSDGMLVLLNTVEEKE